MENSKHPNFREFLSAMYPPEHPIRAGIEKYFDEVNVWSNVLEVATCLCGPYDAENVVGCLAWRWSDSEEITNIICSNGMEFEHIREPGDYEHACWLLLLYCMRDLPPEYCEEANTAIRALLPVLAANVEEIMNENYDLLMENYYEEAYRQEVERQRLDELHYGAYYE